MPRPAALGAVVVIDSLQTADRVLAELAWLNAESVKANGWIEQKLTTVRNEMAPLTKVQIDAGELTLKERGEYLEGLLNEWTAEHGAEHFPEGKKSIELTNGSIGLRQSPQTLEIEDAQRVIDNVDEASCGLIRKAVASFARIVKLIGRCFLNEFVSMSLSVNKKGIGEALKAERVTREKLADIGVIVVPPADVPWCKPNQINPDA